MNEYTFAEIVTGGARNRGNVYRLPSILSLDYHGKQAPTDAYSSVYLHVEDFVTYKDPDGGKRGYTGAVKAEFLHFDFDSPHDDLSLREVRAFTEKLCSADKYGLPIENFRFFYSGNKGFHVYIVTGETRQGMQVPDTVKKICIHLAGKFSSFDRSVYDRTRIFRIPNSRHGKTGLFKIPLLAGELWTLDLTGIKALAARQRSIGGAVAHWSQRMRRTA